MEDCYVFLFMVKLSIGHKKGKWFPLCDWVGGYVGCGKITIANFQPTLKKRYRIFWNSSCVGEIKKKLNMNE